MERFKLLTLWCQSSEQLRAVLEQQVLLVSLITEGLTCDGSNDEKQKTTTHFCLCSLLFVEHCWRTELMGHPSVFVR